MKIAVCVRQGLDGELGVFDACAFEEALKIGGEIVLVSMAPPSAHDFLLSLSRLGAKKIYHICDSAFAGSDTLATAYVLSLALKKISPDLVFCGRQTLIGDTAQTPVMLSKLLNYSLITNAVKINEINDEIVCETRNADKETAALPALLTFERINNLRKPRIGSKFGEIITLSADDLNADLERCGLKGSPTRVIKSRENEGGKRKCKFLPPEKFPETLDNALNLSVIEETKEYLGEKLQKVFSVGESPFEFALSVCDNPEIIENKNKSEIERLIKEEKPDAVLFANDSKGKKLAAELAAELNLGLCADCTSLYVKDKKLIMRRPALSGSVIAEVYSLTSPALATVCTVKSSNDLIVTVGFGAKDDLEKIKAFSKKHNAELGASRKAVDNDVMPYISQVGLTGKTVSPKVYLALGVSGAVHHTVGMDKSGVVIAVNRDKNAPIFDYADYGFVCDVADILNNG